MLSMKMPIAAVPYEEWPLDRLDPQRVEALWCYRAAVPRRQLVLPDGRMDIVVHCRLDSVRRIESIWLAIAGPADGPSTVSMQAGMVSLGVRFRIGWGGLCLGVEPESLQNLVVVGRDAASLIGTSSQALFRSRNLEELRGALTRAAASMAAQARPRVGHGRALRAIDLLQYGTHPSVERFCREIGTTGRTLRRDVLAAAGLPLRTLGGLLRFQRAMGRLKAGAIDSLGELADEAGYSDQAHMTREFRRFGGFTPALPQAVPVVEHANW